MTDEITIETEPQTIFAIPAYRLDLLDAKLDGLNKRAARLGVSPLSYTRTGGEWCDFQIDPKTKKVKAHWEVTEIELLGGQIKLAGWTFCGTIEHLEGENILRAVPGETIPESYRTGSKMCDHCGLDRERIDTFVVRHEDGRVMQLGRSCTRDYLGHADPARLASWLEVVSAFFDDETDEEYDPERSEYVRSTFRPDDIVAVSLAAIRTFGWLSASAVREGRTSGIPTSSRVSQWLSGRQKDRDALEAKGMAVTAEDFEQAEAMVEWAKEQQGGDYIGNLRAYCSQERVDSKALGILTSLPAAHKRALETAAEQAVREAKRAAQREAAGPVPTGKVTIEGEVVSVREVAGDYGVQHKMTVLGTDGWRVYVTIPTAIIDQTQVGSRVRFIATVEAASDDNTMGFAKRPTKAEVLAQAAVSTAADESAA